MRNALSHPRLSLLLVPLALLLLAACSQPPTVSAGGPLRAGTVHTAEGSTLPPVLGAAILLVDFVAALETTSTVTEVSENFYVGPLAPVGSDGAFELTFPAGADIPAGVMLPVEESVINLTGLASCTITATDPSVMVTGMAFEGLTLPGVALVTVEGLYLALSTAEEVEDVDAPDLFESARSQTWVYASGPTQLATSPATCEFPLPSEDSISVNATLSAGWNILEWTIEADATSTGAELRLRNSTAEELHLLPMFTLSGP